MDIYDVFENGLNKETYTRQEVEELICQFADFVDETARGLEEIKREVKKIKRG